MDALSGETLAGKPETVLLDGTPAGHMGPYDRRKLGGCFVPEERNGHGAVTTMSLSENAYLSAHIRGALAKLGVINHGRTNSYAARIIKQFDVRTTGPAALAKSLSGGNLQKFLVGREVLLDPAVLVISQPTWGVDAGAALAIHEAIIALAAAGAAVVIISQDLDEIFLLSDRIAVIAQGSLSQPVPVREASLEKIGLLMGGSAVPHEEPAHV
jgi:simple sugar transport system ATP-binding protein